MGEFREALYVEDSYSRIGKSLSEYEFRVRAESLFEFFVGSVGVNEGYVDAEFLERGAEKVESAAVDVGAAYYMASGLADIEACEEVGCLA